MLFISICLPGYIRAGQSVYVISSQDDSFVKAYQINANQVTFQGIANLLQEGSGTIALASWPQDK
jgi:hypothetical protein